MLSVCVERCNVAANFTFVFGLSLARPIVKLNLLTKSKEAGLGLTTDWTALLSGLHQTRKISKLRFYAKKPAIIIVIFSD